jgi:pimeloyl-ACP methyl ester carboxylesterase
MDLIQRLQYVPTPAWLLTAGLALAFWAATRFLLRRQPRLAERRGGETATQSGAVPAGALKKGKRGVWGALFYVLRLVGFAVGSFVVIGGSVLVYEDYQATVEDLAPAPSQVEIPEDLPFEVQEVTFAGGDGLTMAGWFVPPQNGATIILLHGYGGNRTAMIWHAQVLVKAGYGVLMYDERASGESEGTQRSYGWQDPADVGGALAYLNRRPEVNPGRIGIAGCSIGGQIALQGAAYYPEIGAVWADGPALVRAADNPPPENWATGIFFISNYIIDWMSEQQLGVEAPPPMIEIIGKIAPRPIMLVGGGMPLCYAGSEAPHVERFAAYAGENADTWIIPEAHHCDGPVQRPEEYSARMVGFFNAAFGHE